MFVEEKYFLMFQEDFYSEMYVCIIQVRRLKKKIKKKIFLNVEF